MKSHFLLTALLCFFYVASNHAQQHPITDSNVNQAIVSESTHPEDSLVVDNSEAINLMLQSNNADMEVSIKESVISELMQNTENALQRRELERKMYEIHREDSLRRENQQRRIDSLKQTAVGVPVLLKQDTLYTIFTSIGAISPTERAKLHAEKIYNTAKIFSLKTDSIHIVEGYSTSDIVYGNTVIASVTDNDAMWMNTTRDSLALKHVNSIVNAIKAYKKQTELWNTIKIICLCVLLFVVQFGLFKGIAYLFNYVIRRTIIKYKKKLFKGWIFRDYEILNANRQLRMFIGLVKICKYLFYIILFYLTIPLLFSIFPPTRYIAEVLFGWILTPIQTVGSGIIDFLPNLIKIIIILIAVHYIIKFLKYIANEITEKRLVIPGFYPDWAKATLNIIRIIIYAFTVVMIFQLLPWADSPIFQGVSVFIGLLVSLGSTSVISNLMAGMVITYMRPFIQGDRIRIGDTYGDVVEKTPFVIRILTPKNEVVTVPNATVLSSNVINYSSKTKDRKDSGVIIHTTVTMGYDVPWTQTHQLLIEAALKTPHIHHKPAPFVLQTALNDFSISYQINAYTKDAGKMPLIYSELYKNILELFRDAGIELMTPHYQAYRDGNHITIPPVYDTSESKKESKNNPKPTK
jgi:small-conductance mechanosensitive channel